MSKLAERMQEKGVTEEDLDKFLNMEVKTDINYISNLLFNQMLMNGEAFTSIDKYGNVKVITDIDEIEDIKEKIK